MDSRAEERVKSRNLRIVFFSFESNLGRPIRFRIKYSNRIGRIYHASHNTAWLTAGKTGMLTTSIVNEREWGMELSTCSFQFSPITRQTMPLYAYLTPKVDLKRKFNQYQSFLNEWRLTARTIRKFRIGPSLRIESRIGRTIRKRIESRSFAGP